MPGSILNTIKKLLGILEGDPAFDTDLIVHINSAIMILSQLGIGPTPVYVITDAEQEWTDYLENVADYAGIQTYIFLQVRLLFDPPSSSFVLEGIKTNIAEYGWRLMVMADPPPEVTIPEEE